MAKITNMREYIREVPKAPTLAFYREILKTRVEIENSVTPITEFFVCYSGKQTGRNVFRKSGKFFYRVETQKVDYCEDGFRRDYHYKEEKVVLFEEQELAAKEFWKLKKEQLKKAVEDARELYCDELRRYKRRVDEIKTRLLSLKKEWEQEASTRYLRKGEWDRIEVLKDSFAKMGIDWGEDIVQKEIPTEVYLDWEPSDEEKWLDEETLREKENEALDAALHYLGVTWDDLEKEGEIFILERENLSIKVEFKDGVGFRLDASAPVNTTTMAFGRCGLCVK